MVTIAGKQIFLGVVLHCWESRQLLMTLSSDFWQYQTSNKHKLFPKQWFTTVWNGIYRITLQSSKIGSNLDLLFLILLKILSVFNASRCHSCFTWSAVGSILKEGRCRSQFIDIYSSLLAHSSGELAGRWVISLRTDNSW